jgi:hypothetical protein
LFDLQIGGAGIFAFDQTRQRYCHNPIHRAVCARLPDRSPLEQARIAPRGDCELRDWEL